MRIPEHKNFMEELQSLDASMKRRLLFAGTLIIMVIVVYFWLAYFNNLVSTISQPALAQTNAAQAPAPAQPQAATSDSTTSNPTVWQNVTGGTAFILHEFEGAGGKIKNMFQTPKQYIIHGQ